MHASTIAILAIVAAPAPAFSQPIYARHPKIKADDIKDGIDIGNSIINAAGSLKQAITGHSRRYLGELLARAYEEDLMARDYEDELMARAVEFKRGSFSSFLHLKPKPKPKRLLEQELMAREYAADADVFDKRGMNWNPVKVLIKPRPRPRAYEEELMARDFEDDSEFSQDEIIKRGMNWNPVKALIKPRPRAFHPSSLNELD
ncbi:hypothetical protein EUX98_g5604 [Antrodiella citrinella]|uniref:Uncharacterized protein n=1 Tax=Antrodiella citrinella TaxID=2447956 RepID=A0A4S4MT07_9APHY|nr:hypothetical protein EUX98_g5604 [Antrodiella citrinella]